MNIYDVCIIGGGAAGLAAAASLDNDIKKCILEKNKILGRKISATGGGRCNITNEACSNKDIALDFLKLWDLKHTVTAKADIILIQIRHLTL